MSSCLSSSSSSSTSFSLQLISSWVVSPRYAFFPTFFLCDLVLTLSCRPSPRRQPHPSSELSCWCKTRMRWCVAHTLPSIQLIWLSDQARSSCHTIQGCHRCFHSYLQGRGSCLAMAWKHRQRDPLLPYAGFELRLQYARSLCFLQHLIIDLQRTTSSRFSASRSRRGTGDGSVVMSPLVVLPAPHRFSSCTRSITPVPALPTMPSPRRVVEPVSSTVLSMSIRRRSRLMALRVSTVALYLRWLGSLSTVVFISVSMIRSVCHLFTSLVDQY